MPKLICYLIMQHELGPGGLRQPADKVPVIFAV